MTDLFGFAAPRPAFVDIRNTRPSAAEEKAQLALTLNQLCRTPPKSLGSASINTVRAWKDAHKSALKVLNSKSSSRTDLQSAINNLRRYEA
jgi:hypothetical protein